MIVLRPAKRTEGSVSDKPIPERWTAESERCVVCNDEKSCAHCENTGLSTNARRLRAEAKVRELEQALQHYAVLGCYQRRAQSARRSMSEYGNAMDRDELKDRRKEVTALQARIRELEQERDREAGRWQEEVYDLLRKHVPHPDAIDGGGCDSGDPLDFTLAEVSQGLDQLQAQLQAVTGELASIKSPDLKKEKLVHGMNCSAWHSEHGQEVNAEDCTCGLRFRIFVQTEQTLHAAWRKRAEEAETSLQAVTQERDAARGYVQFIREECHRLQVISGCTGRDEPGDAIALVGAKFAQLQAHNSELAAALVHICEWSLPDTGRKWGDGSPMSYGACYGSNGERDYMRKIAATALALAAQAKP